MYCEICKSETNYTLDHFGPYHLRKLHPEVTMKDYYNLINKTDGKCKVCGFDRTYISFLKGYRACNCGSGITCKICNKSLKRNYSIGPHLKNLHNTNIHDYSETYLRPYIGKFCKVCRKPTNLKSLLHGYFDHCSKECVNKSKNVRDAAQKTTKKNFGVECLLNSDELKTDKYKNSGLSSLEIDYLLSNKDLFDYYQKTCRKVNTNKKLRAQILANQNNLDYYTNTNITTTVTIDHKIPVLIGFVKHIPIYLMNDMNNLCVTSCSNNTIKSSLPFEYIKDMMAERIKSSKNPKTISELTWFIKICEHEINNNKIRKYISYSQND